MLTVFRSVFRSDRIIILTVVCLAAGLLSACAARAVASARYQVDSTAGQRQFEPIPPFIPPRLLPSDSLVIVSQSPADADDVLDTTENAGGNAQATSPLATPPAPDTGQGELAQDDPALDEEPALYLASIAKSMHKSDDSQSPQASPLPGEPTLIVVVVPPTSLLPTPTPTPVITAPPAEQSQATEPQPVTEATVVAALTQPLNPPLATAQTTEPLPDGAARTVKVPILMYHYLSDPPADADIYRVDLSVSPVQFSAHLDAMQEAGYTAISLYDLVAHLNQGEPLPEKPVILTFDDGYRDNYENAFPILLAHDMRATFFVVSDFIDDQRSEYITWEMVREMFAAGMWIESHGRNHVSLRGKDSDYLIWQALGSLETIQYEIGVRPRFISYPAGEYDQATIDIFKSANYWAGVTTIQGATHSSQDLFQLHRVRVRNSTTSAELLRLLALDW